MTQRRGQTTIELTLLLTALVLGLAAMGLYYQWAAQHQLFSGSQAIGAQFDPRASEWYEEREMPSAGHETSSDGVKRWVRRAMLDAELLKPTTNRVYSSWVGDPNFSTLTDLPKGPIPREPASWQKVDSSSQWLTRRYGAYDQAHRPLTEE